MNPLQELLTSVLDYSDTQSDSDHGKGVVKTELWAGKMALHVMELATQAQ